MYSARARLLFATFAFVLLSGASASHRALPQDAYIWQRKWTPALRVALKQSADLVHAWRVLAAYSDEGGHLQPVAVDWKALKSSGRPVIAVVRINGQLAQYNDDQLLRDLDGLLSRMAADEPPIAGLEIDHDCGVARLDAYAQFLVTCTRAARPNDSVVDNRLAGVAVVAQARRRFPAGERSRPAGAHGAKSARRIVRRGPGTPVDSRTVPIAPTSRFAWRCPHTACASRGARTGACSLSRAKSRCWPAAIRPAN